jgi:glyoxylase-like metal-dependent hydrolase (beta-lactamase superfamily II)/8-oxo-dGTP pyrophosphatase MutT (NUDIX family)
MEVPPAHRPPRDAATMVVVRDAPGGMEVLMLQRADSSDPLDHHSGAWVFPGGTVDPSDRQWHGCCTETDDSAASAHLSVTEGGLDFYIAAIRECFEEAGLLFAVSPDGEWADPQASLISWRHRLYRGEVTLGHLCRDLGLRLAVNRMLYLSHWMSPLGRSKRFDTRFFLAVAPPSQTPLHDGGETVASAWVRAADWMNRDSVKLISPTRATLKLLAEFDSVDALWSWARSPRDVARTTPRLGSGRQGVRAVLPHEGAFAEIGRLDPIGHGKVLYEIQPGVPVRLSPRVIRLTAPNASLMTGPGTNSYLVGGGDNTWAVIDPGPAQTGVVDALIAAAPGPIHWIFVTHTHMDHSPAATELKRRTGASIHGRLADHSNGQDPEFAPDRELQDGDRIVLQEGVTLRAIHTPGHASNHICYLLEEERTLFTGDHVMQGSTVVIRPPDGDMAAYLASLQLLQAHELDWLAPGHGFLIGHPREAIGALIRHRKGREDKVIAALKDTGPASVDELLDRVYADVDARLHSIAIDSLRAHLLKLCQDGVAEETASGGRWVLAG